MSDFTHLIIALVLFYLLDRFLKPQPLRRWSGLLMVAVGGVGTVGYGVVSQTHVFGLDLGLLSALAMPLGIGLFRRRRRFEPAG